VEIKKTKIKRNKKKKNPDMVKGVAKIPLFIEGADYKDKLLLLARIAHELRIVKNYAMRLCLGYKVAQDSGFEILTKENKKTSYDTFIDHKIKESVAFKYASKTLISHASHEAVKKWSSDQKELLANKRSLAVFNELNIPCHKQGSKLYVQDGEYYFEPLSLNKIKFKMMISKDKSNITIVDGIITGNYFQCDSQLIRKEKYSRKEKKNVNIWYLYLTYEFLKIKKSVDPDIVCGMDSNANSGNLITLAIAGSYKHEYFGSMDDIKRKTVHCGMQAKRLKQRSLKITSGGHGRSKKLKSLEKFEEREHNIRTRYNHVLSKKVVAWCVSNNVGTIKMENLSHIHQHIENSFLKRNWTYYQIQQMIRYKAERVGIKVVKVNAAGTSQTCSKCGYRDKDNRKTQNKFVCLKCGFDLNADWNAAINIASRLEESAKLIDDSDIEDGLPVQVVAGG